MWSSSVQVQASERYPIALMLVGWKRGEPIANVVCTLVTCKLSKLCDKLITLHVQNSVSGSRKNSSSKRKFYSQTSSCSTEGELLMHKIHKWGHSLTLTHPWKQILGTFCCCVNCKANYRTVCTWRALDIRAIHPFPGRLIANDVRFSSSYQTRAVAAARRLTPHFGRHVSIKFSKPLDWAAWTGCLAPRSPDCTPFD